MIIDRILYKNLKYFKDRYYMIKTEVRTFRCGMRFRPGFDVQDTYHQSSMDRMVWNYLLETFKREYKIMRHTNCSRTRIGRWYVEVQNLGSGPRG